MKTAQRLVAAAVLSLVALVPAAAQGSRTQVAEIPAPSLAGNLLGEPLEQKLVVYLPPSYFESNRRYPVVYYFHGFSMSPYDLSTFVRRFDSQMKDSASQFIIVGVNGHNSLGGCFWVNSPVTGGWEDFVIKDVVPYVDSTYRTVALREARGISGWSMGGFAAINLALRHPDVFSAVYSVGPGLFDPQGLKEAFSTWDRAFLEAYGSAFSPDTKKPGAPFCNIPDFSGTKADNAVLADWETGFGNLTQKIQAYIRIGTPLKAIRIWYGKRDFYTWIPKGSVYFSELLKNDGVPHELKEFDGGHDQAILRQDYVSFFSSTLQVPE